MIIKKAKTAGFCFGVNRAIEMIYDLLAKNKSVYTLGPIIHNPQMVKELEDKGVRIINSIDETLPLDATIVIRSHGIPMNIMDKIKASGVNYADATCPFVSKIHKIVYKASSEGNIVLIAGDESHPEVEGIRGYCTGKSFVFKTEQELKEIIEKSEFDAQKLLTIVAQTTFSTIEWEKCVKLIKLVYTNALIFDTICNATEERQKEAIDLSKNSDAMVIVGGRHSSNTAKLASVCAPNCPTFLIETADELPLEAIANCNSISVTAGASTPAGIIKEVLKTMSEIQNDITKDVNEEFNFMEALEESFKNLSTDQKVKGVVLRIEPTEIQVDIGRKHAGYIPVAEFSADQNAVPSDTIAVGDVLDLIIMRTNDQEGTVMLSKKRFDALKGWDSIVKASEEETVLEGVVTDVIRGGVLVVTNGVKVFVPASLATASRSDSLESLLKTTVKFRVIEINQGRKRAVGSIRSVLKEARKEQEEAFWASVEVGQTFTGNVKSITAYGAFVDLGGVDGMVHISQLSWSRIKHPSEVVSVGDEVTVTVREVDKEKKKISLSYKKTEDNPWEIMAREYPEGTVADAKIVSMTTFGAFAQVIPGVDGLIHISQISNNRVNKPQDVLKVGDIVKVKITAIDFDKKRVSLSMRALLEETQETAQDEQDA